MQHNINEMSFIDSNNSDLVLFWSGQIELLFCVLRRPIFPAQNLLFFSANHERASSTGTVIFIHLCIWQTLVSKVICIAFKLHIFSVHAFHGNQTRDLCVASVFSSKMTNLCVRLQADQLMFALHFVKGMNPELFQENVSVCVCALNS